MGNKRIVTLGMFIIDSFKFLDENEKELPGKSLDEQIGGGGTYCAIGARIWLPSSDIGMVVDRGSNFPNWVQDSLDHYGRDMWLFRDQSERVTTRAVNIYKGDYRGFEYLTPRVRVTPIDLALTPLERPEYIHFICSPQRANQIVKEVLAVKDWKPKIVYEPIPDRCVPEELPALRLVLKYIDVLSLWILNNTLHSPNAEEALSLLSIPLPPTRESIEHAAAEFLSFGIASIIIRSGPLGAYVITSESVAGTWIEAYFTLNERDRVQDVTGAGNAFLGGLMAGLVLEDGDLLKATLYGTISAGYTIEQNGLPRLSRAKGAGVDEEYWNDEPPRTRLSKLVHRIEQARN